MLLLFLLVGVRDLDASSAVMEGFDASFSIPSPMMAPLSLVPSIDNVGTGYRNDWKVVELTGRSWNRLESHGS